MYPDHLRYLNEKGATWFNPWFGLNEFWPEVKKVAKKLNVPLLEAWKHRNLKRAKEIYAFCILAAALSKQDDGEWWVIKPKADPPDGVIGQSVVLNGRKEMHVREIEVVEHLGGDIVVTIKNKLAGKKYEPHTWLICYLSELGDFDLKEVSETLKKEQINLEYIFLSFLGLNFSEIPADNTKKEELLKLFKPTSVEIWPDFSSMSINLKKDFTEKRKEQGRFLIYAGRGNKVHQRVSVKEPPKLY